MVGPITGDELTLYRSGRWASILRAAIYPPNTIYTARINQIFTTFDGILEITYDGGAGTLADVLPDMTLFIGTSAGAWDKGICRVRSIDATTVYISQTADIAFADNQYLTIVDDFSLFAKHILIDEGVTFIDGGIEYSDQHTNFDPTPIMGSNRVLKLTGETVTATFDFSDSYVIDGSSITEFITTSPTASGGADLDTDAPTLEWDTVGWHLVYLTLTTENEKSFFGVRYVYIWNDDNPPPPVVYRKGSQDVDTGGWEFTIAMHSDASLNAVRDHALVIVFAEDYYGDEQQSIGPLAGCENVVFTGWIAKETISITPERSLVEFTAYTGQYFMGQVPAYPNGVEFVTGTPAAWTQMKNLTVDLGAWHFLHWRTTATRVMDVFLSGDTRYTKEVSSLGSNMWNQLREMEFEQILARPGVNRYNQLFVEVHPCLLPTASRSSIPVVMEILGSDRVEEIEFERVTIPEVAIVSGSGVSVNSTGTGTPYFSLAPGHTFPHYGSAESIDNLLVSGQSQANILFGLYRSWRNNPLPEVPITFLGNNRFVDCFPNQFYAIDIDAADNIRGVGYNGNLIPLSVSFEYDAETGYLHTEATFEAETFEGIASDGDVPGGSDRSTPPVPPLPRLPDLPPIILPGGPSLPGTGGPRKVMMFDADPAGGLVYSENFDASGASVIWRFINAGMELIPASTYGTNFLEICPNGAVYAGLVNGIDTYLARAPRAGEPFVQQVIPGYIRMIGVNLTVPEKLLIAVTPADESSDILSYYIGANGSYTGPLTSGGLSSALGYAGPNKLTYGGGKWFTLALLQYGWLAPDATTGDATLPITAAGATLRASTTGRLFFKEYLVDNLMRAEGNVVDDGVEVVSSGDLVVIEEDDMYLTIACDPAGNYLMARALVGEKGRSSDGGVTWSPIPDLPPGNWHFAYAGGAGVASCWIATSGTQIKYSPDFGETWYEKLGNLTGVSPTPDPVIIRVVEY